MIDAILPDQLSSGWALVLFVLSFIASAFTVAFGIGGGVALIAVLLQILPPAIVIPIHGLVQTGSNAGRAWTMREHIRVPIVKWFAMGAVIGVILASLIFFSLPTRGLTVALGLFILWSVWAPKYKASSIPDKGFAGVGALASFLTMFLGATGPIVAAFWNQEKLGKEGQVATHGAVMTMVHGFKVIAFGFLGFAFGEWMVFLILMILSGYAGTLLGKRVLSHFDERTFSIGFKAVLTLLALRLVWQGITG